MYITVPGLPRIRYAKLARDNDAKHVPRKGMKRSSTTKSFRGIIKARVDTDEPEIISLKLISACANSVLNCPARFE